MKERAETYVTIDNALRLAAGALNKFLALQKGNPALQGVLEGFVNSGAVGERYRVYFTADKAAGIAEAARAGICTDGRGNFQEVSQLV